MMDLARSAQESLDLAFLFLEDGNDDLLLKWFAGKIIKNEEARKAFDKYLNAGTVSLETLPIKEAKAHMYHIYSMYTHSSYGALLDSVDVFREDLDFEGQAGFHYTNRNFHVVRSLASSIILNLKNIAGKLNDRAMFLEADRIYNLIVPSEIRLNEEQIKDQIQELIKKYPRKT
jgi:hypothetical protein